MIELDIATLAVLSGVVVPLLVGVVTKLHASSRVKAVANLVLSLAAGGLTFLTQNSGSARWQELALSMGMAYLSSGVSYQNLWKPTGVGQVVQEGTASLGVG